MILAMGCITVLGLLLVWSHHMMTVGLERYTAVDVALHNTSSVIAWIKHVVEFQGC